MVLLAFELRLKVRVRFVSVKDEIGAGRETIPVLERKTPRIRPETAEHNPPPKR